MRASPDRAQKHIETAKHRKKESILTKYRKSRDLKTEIKDRMKVKEEPTKIFGEREVRILLEDCEGSQRDLLRVIKWMRQCFGRKHFSPKIREVMKEYLSRYDTIHTSEREIVLDKNGEEKMSVISRVVDIN